MNSMSRTLTFGPSLMSKTTLHQLGPARQLLDARLDLGELVALLRHHAAQDAFDPAHGALIEERIEPQRDARLLHLLVDLGAVDLARPGVVDDLDARPLFHVEDDVLAHHAVGVRRVARPRSEVVEEVGRPQPLEVLEQRLLGLLVEGHPDAVERPARLRLDVIEVGLRLDERLVDRLEPQFDEPHQRAGIRRRQRQRRLFVGDSGLGACEPARPAAGARAAAQHREGKAPETA